MNRVQLRARGPEGTSRLEMFSKLYWGLEGVCQSFPRGAAFFSDSERYAIHSMAVYGVDVLDHAKELVCLG